ncbi:unnamed protein product [Ambrosiozyma monospora]|uniref:Unnamed protein product n=1 Tax=Ambrosiozyma monospora TaxID=43982 RepID=A0A9W6Z107_AMBMO|nr:unnamed protein product [Ambrosiozyma monospora]
MMIGIGNVGENLESYYSGNTYLTTNGGITWREVKKGVYMWEYGDQGSVIVLVNGKDNTNKLSYSVDEGENWVDYQFTDEEVTVEDISNIPSDNSLTFLLFTRVPLARGDKTKVFRIDFSQLLRDKCNLDLEHPDADDFTLWTPVNPLQKNGCLLGHEVQYYRKNRGSTATRTLCRVGKKLIQPYTVVRNCPCTKQDYECDFNHFRDSSGSCKLIHHSSGLYRSQICNADDAPDEYFLPTGYRKISLSTCEGGEELDKSSKSQPCKGKEDKFYKKHPRASLFSKFLLWLLIIVAILLVVNVAYKFYLNHRYGEIRLDEESNFSVVENVGGHDVYLQQFKDYSGQFVITSLAVTSQAIRYVVLAVKDIRSKLKHRLTGSGYRGGTSAYIVTDEDANEFFRENEAEEEEFVDDGNSASPVPELHDDSDDEEAPLNDSGH